MKFIVFFLSICFGSIPTCWWNRNIQLFAFDKKTNIIFCYLSLAKLKGEDLRLDARRLENECAFIDAYYVYKLLAYEISYRACNFLSTFKSRMRKMRIVETKQNNKKTKHDANFYWIMYYILSFDFLLLWILIIIMIHQKNQNNWNSRFFFHSNVKNGGMIRNSFCARMLRSDKMIHKHDSMIFNANVVAFDLDSIWYSNWYLYYSAFRCLYFPHYFLFMNCVFEMLLEYPISNYQRSPNCQW